MHDNEWVSKILSQYGKCQYSVNRSSKVHTIGHFLNHVQNKVRVSVGELTRFVNMTDWMRKVKRSVITERG